MAINKYIRTLKGFTVFPMFYEHKDMAHGCCSAAVHPLSAGQCIIDVNKGGQLYVKCYGDSLTLGLVSLPEDSQLLNKQLTEVSVC